MDAMDRVLATADRQDGIISGAQCRHLGLAPDTVKTLCRSGRWQRLHQGVYLVGELGVTEPGRRGTVRAALLSAGPDAVAVLDTAAALHGIGGVPRPADSVQLNLPGHLARHRRLAAPGLVLHQLTLGPSDTMLVDGLTVTTPLRTVADLILRLDRYSAVAVMDSALNRGLIDGLGLTRLSPMIAGRRGARRARPWIREADPRAQSPLETRVRLRCVDGRVPPETLQYPVYDEQGRLLGIADFGWPHAGLLAEADGADIHDRPEAVFHDRRRQNELANAGWTILRFTWSDTLNPEYIPGVVRRALTHSPGWSRSIMT